MLTQINMYDMDIVRCESHMYHVTKLEKNMGWQRQWGHIACHLPKMNSDT